ncbi:ATP-binding protein [Desulfohalobium retbaense]|uniref:histidine kinase n=1 Tax=Desulfohalobium retbaense (strain ATCC 49708 / DSM 5692 / JCM 16813 / HR100) TaxID=485915 RepID=C8WZA5_DESRD|nr:ATP-binding protein [Desulfohalobium retbaense]ACV67380.1 histidine kinase [Desulfohalobium retbaense DSM 5692]
MRTPLRPNPAHPFQLVKFLSWSSLFIILGSIFFLALTIGNSAKQAVMQKHRDFALLLAENLNHQIYQRFTLPTVLGFGRIQLKNEAQYQRLEETIQSTIHSFHVLDVRIYDWEGMVVYSTDKTLVGKAGLAGPEVKKAVDTGEPSFTVQGELSFWRAMFDFDLPAKTFVLRTTYPLRAERTLQPSQKAGPIMGILEFRQDISKDYETILRFQWVVVFLALGASLILFLLLYIIIKRADRLLAERIQEKERLERELLQNEKLASMGRMVASIAHEIRNPLGIIRSSSEMLYKKALRDNSQNARLLHAVFQESKRLSQTVHEFLDYARPKQPAMREVDCSQILQRALAFLEQECAAHEIQVTTALPETLPSQGDDDLLYRAFYNIISNALQSMDGGGELDISGGREEDQIWICIRDTGPGFDATMLDKYLEPFYTTKDQGTGLGLAIVKNIVDSHGGSLNITNTETGAEVCIRLQAG